jgi:CheY-like chemotaxis protein
MVVMDACDAKVLLVDDEHDCADQLCEFLVRRGLSSRAAYSAAEALDLLPACPEIRVLVSDIKMPGLTGFALIDKVNEHMTAANRTSPACILMTGHAGQVEADISTAYGVVGFLSKPIDPYALERLIRDHLSRVDPDVPTAGRSPV